MFWSWCQHLYLQLPRQVWVNAFLHCPQKTARTSLWHFCSVASVLFITWPPDFVCLFGLFCWGGKFMAIAKEFTPWGWGAEGKKKVITLFWSQVYFSSRRLHVICVACLGDCGADPQPEWIITGINSSDCWHKLFSSPGKFLYFSMKQMGL